MDATECAEVDRMVQDCFGPDEPSGASPSHPTSQTSDQHKVMDSDKGASVCNARPGSTPDPTGDPAGTSASERVDLGIVHRQCNNARAVEARVQLTSLSNNATIGTSVMAEPVQIGTLNAPGDSMVGKTFYGGRVKKGNDMVNQALTMTFDPNNLNCICCASEHSMMQGDKPVVLMVSDQNFVSVWPGANPDNCVPIVRIGNPTLHELVDVLFEIMDRRSPADGSVIMIGAVSYLCRAGVSMYSSEWTQVVGRVGRRWPNVRVAPAIPMLRESCPGGVSREIVMFAIWLFRVYSENLTGM